MNNRRLALLMVCMLSAASQATAAPAIMLQFGSFESRAEADAKLNDVKAKHNGVLGTLPSSIREVTLPPDNLTVYRTQAGPVTTRTEAQSICAQLASNGDECYVVETAMLPPTSPAAQVAAPITPPPPAPEKTASLPPLAPSAQEPVAPPAFKGAPLPPPAPLPPLAAAAPAPAATPEILPKPSPSPLPTPAPAPVAPKPVVNLAPLNVPASKTPAPTLAPATTQVIPLVAPRSLPPGSASSNISVTVPERDPRNQAALAGITGKAIVPVPNAPVPASIPADKPISNQDLAKPSPQLQAAMDRAAAADDAALRPPVVENTATADPEKKSSGFWSRMNPFGEDEPAESAAPATASLLPPPAPASIPVATPVAEPKITTRTVMPVAGAAPVAVPSPVLAAPPPVIVNKPPVVVANATPVITTPEPMRLPPPPPPLRAEDRSMMPPPTPTGTLPGNNVRVEEAKRVPLTETTVPVPPPVASVPGPAPVASYALQPSATIGQKTLWAQIGQFEDTQSALSFWDGFRRAHPDFPVVRVRVTTPYMAKTRGDERVWLRVGPFAKEGFIGNLCGSIDPDELRCGHVMDMGVASSSNRTPGFLPGSRYNR